MARAKAEPKEQEIVIPPLRKGHTKVWIQGTSPLIFNCMSAKATHNLLYPQPKTKATKRDNLKHEPMSEYRNSVYRAREDGPTRLVLPSTAIKGAMRSAALEIPGVMKTQIGRLLWVQGYNIPVWGIPQMLMSVVRSADKNRTPDIRTRAIISDWCACAEIEYVMPAINDTVLARLIGMAGAVIGLGDFR